MRILIAEDSGLLRGALVQLLQQRGHDTIAVADADALDKAIDSEDFDAALLDVRLPPTQVDEGARAAVALRQRNPTVGILLLSAHVEAHYAVRLLRDHPRGFGYLLKDRIIDIDELFETLDRVVAGGYAVDPTVISQLLRRNTDTTSVDRLTPREREILGLLAEGLSNAAVGQRLYLSGKTVENHISNIFTKLDLTDSPHDHRRVKAVLLHLSSQNS